jgi:hypothetical protein
MPSLARLAIMGGAAVVVTAGAVVLATAMRSQPPIPRLALPPPDSSAADLLALARVRGGHTGAATGPEAALHPSDEPVSDHCTCGAARRVNGWCHACGRGHLAGSEIASAMLFEAIDPHGHDFERSSIEDCSGCRDALASEGFCTPHGWGFAGGLMYTTRLTWALARGEGVEPAALFCDACRAHLRSPGWCEACGRGHVGTVAFTDRGLFEAAARGWVRLARAIDESRRCETCATACFFGTTCPKCRVSYGAGEGAIP